LHPGCTPGEDAHGPNEFFRLSSFDEWLKSRRKLLGELGKLDAEAFAQFRH